MDFKVLEFLAFCIGAVAGRHSLSRNEVYGRLKSSGILDDYIIPSYDVLHTFGAEYIVDDITDLMKKKGVLA